MYQFESQNSKLMRPFLIRVEVSIANKSSGTSPLHNSMKMKSSYMVRSLVHDPIKSGIRPVTSRSTIQLVRTLRKKHPTPKPKLM